ncbi:MAG: hypothetical protein WCS99_20930 [Limisphaerales bacterium]
MRPRILNPESLNVLLPLLAAGVLIAVASGCTSVAQVGLDYATTKIIDGSGSSVSLDGQTITLSGWLEPRTDRSGAGVLVVGLKSSGTWPQGWRAAQFSFRPEGASQSFSFIEIDTDESLLRAIGPDVFQPKIEERDGTKYFRLQLKSMAERPYEVLVSLRHVEGRRANLALRSVAKKS